MIEGFIIKGFDRNDFLCSSKENSLKNVKGLIKSIDENKNVLHFIHTFFLIKSLVHIRKYSEQEVEILFTQLKDKNPELYNIHPPFMKNG